MVAAGLLFFAFISLALARPTGFDELHVHERRSSVPDGFKYLGKADPNATLKLRIALAQSNPAGLEAALYGVSTPGSKNYRQHLSKAEVQALVAPKPESVKAVRTWLSNNNVAATQASPAGDWLSIEVPVSKASTLLGTQFGEYAHERSNTSMIRTLAYSVPASVKGHLDVIFPVTSFIEPRISPASAQVIHSIHARSSDEKEKRTVAKSTSRKTAPTVVAAVDGSCKTVITPKCLQSIYNIPSAPASSNSSSIIVASFAGEAATSQDLQMFLTQFRPDVKKKVSSQSIFAVKSLDGGATDFSSGTTEASLDIQYTVGVATNVPTTFVSVGSNTTDGIAGFLDIINNLLAQDEVPSVLTTSFGFNEKDIPSGVGRNLCNAYAQLGARGTTVLFGSGDGGVSGIQSTQGCNTFVPTFPSTCPFVTSVGGTRGVGPEVAVSFSSGGFSNLFPRPQYQDKAVTAYLKKLGKTNSGLFNSSGRAFPDIAAQAQGFQVVRNGEVIPVAGTSAASPTVASLVALLNDAILNDGGKPMGFLNPFLYSTGTRALTDVTQGNNPGCGTSGFPATSGWDAVTGLGTPDFAKLLNTAKKNVLGGQ
ncbi:family S53 protease-like protein [Trametes maxima]|nr:family S53 protease-like protein [Trametes maxima]